jgi:biopolymer transport protein ExbB
VLEPWYAVEAFIERGGPVLYVIAFVLALMWTLIIERYWYIRTGHRAVVQRVQDEWSARSDRRNWYAKQIRTQLISDVSSGLSRGIGLLQTLVGICSLLGLLGTVTGMITVFDTMAITGSSNARLMAEGVSKATIPTMAGMVAAISGLYLTVRLQNFVQRETERVEDLLTQE